MYKLLLYGVSGKLYEAVKALYSSTSACIKLSGTHSNWFQTVSGVRQGDSLSPTLFNVYINDLVEEISDLNLGVNIGESILSTLLYADDLVLMADTEENLHTMLNKLYDWCKRWQMKINFNKTNVIHFRSKRRPKTKYIFILEGNILELVPKYKYLGFYFDEHLDFQEGINTLSEAAGRALGSVISKFKSLKNVGFKTYTKLYDSGVVPISDYFSELWGSKKSPVQDKIHNRAIRYFLGVHSMTPIPALQIELGWVPVFYRHSLKCIKY